MRQSRDPLSRAALLMGARVLALLAVLGGAAVVAILQLRPGGPDATAPAVLPRVAAPVLLSPVVEPPRPRPLSAAAAASLAVWLRDLEAPPRAMVLDADGIAADTICSALARMGWAIGGWAISELEPSLYECFGERRFGDAPAGEATNAFTILRGTQAGALREMRIKLNILDETSAPEASDDLAATLDAVFETLRWDLPADVRDAVRARRAASYERSGATLRFWREEGEVARYNLRLLVPEPLAAADRFVARRVGARSDPRPAAARAAPDAASP